MVALKSSNVEAFVARPDPDRPVVLIFGPDAGLVAERALGVIQASVEDLNDPFALVRLHGDDLNSDPARLLDEANTVPLFGGRRAIWVKAGSRDFSGAVGAVIAASIHGCRVVIEAGDLRPNAPLRALCERAASAVAIACYGDSERDLIRLIDEEIRAAGLSIAAEARTALLPLLGSDRRASRNEVRKLALYARGKPRIEIDDVIAAVADASALALDNVIDATFAGRTGEVETQFGKARAAGVAPGRIISAALAQVGPLHKARLAIERGTTLAEAVDQVVSKAQFRRKPAIEAALRLWTAGRLERVMAQLAEVQLEVRRLSGPLAPFTEQMVNRALLSVALAARRKE